ILQPLEGFNSIGAGRNVLQAQGEQRQASGLKGGLVGIRPIAPAVGELASQEFFSKRLGNHCAKAVVEQDSGSVKRLGQRQQRRGYLNCRLRADYFLSAAARPVVPLIRGVCRVGRNSTSEIFLARDLLRAWRHTVERTAWEEIRPAKFCWHKTCSGFGSVRSAKPMGRNSTSKI